MQDRENTVVTKPRRVPWNKGKLIGAKPPLRPKHVWSIRTKLQVEGRTRDLAMFNLAIDSKLRGCDVVALKVEDVAPSGYAVDRATVRQKKTGQPVRFELTEQSRQAVDDYVRAAAKKPGEFKFTGRPGSGKHHDETIRAARFRVDRKHRPRPTSFRHPLTTTDQGNPDLPAYRQSARRAAPARAHKDRKHRPVPWHRGR
jgi:integrase